MYRGNVANRLRVGLPANTRNAVADTLAGATTAHLPRGIAVPTLDAAHHAFTAGFSVCAVIALALAVLTATQLNRTSSPVPAPITDQEITTTVCTAAAHETRAASSHPRL